MAKIGTGVMKQWQDGETIHAVEYNNERNLIVEAFNDTQEQVDTIKNTASVGTSMLQNLAVTTDKLANSSVTANKISDAAVTTTKLADASVTEQKIAINAITETKIDDSAVTTAKIAPASVTSDKLAPTSVTSDKVSAGAVTTDKIFDGAVTQTKIADGSIGLSKLADGSVVTTKIADESVSSSKLAVGAVTPDKIVKESVTQFAYDKNETDVRIANAIAGGIPQSVIDQIKTEVTGDISDIVAAVGDISVLPAGMGLAEVYTAVNEDLYMHKNNADVHVTAQEKIAWNAKETTLGAQNKANAARDEAYQDSKAYVNDLVKVGLLYGTTTGSANTYALSVDSNVIYGAINAGLRVSFKVNVANTGSSTLNVNGLGAKTIKKSNGSNLSAGNLVAGSVYTAIYDGTNFILQGEGGEYGTATSGQVLTGYTIGTDAGIVSGSMPNRGTIETTISTQNGQYAIPQGYHTGSGIVTASFANLVAGNVKSGVNIGGVVGNLQSESSASLNYSIPWPTTDFPPNASTFYEVFAFPAGTTKFSFISGGSNSTISSNYMTNYNGTKIKFTIRDSVGSGFDFPEITGTGATVSAKIISFSYDKNSNKLIYCIMNNDGAAYYLSRDLGTAFNNSGIIRMGFVITTGTYSSGSFALVGDLSYSV